MSRRPTVEGLDSFRTRARAWLSENAEPRPPEVHGSVWGEGSDSVALFHNMTASEERAHIHAQRSWIQRKADAGFANLTWDEEWGGQGLSLAHERAFQEEERRFVTPPNHEAVSITVGLIGPTIRAYGTTEQCARYLRACIRTDELWCQLFSEPGAGSDLASAATRAEQDGDDWILNGQKVWTSGAQYADFGYALCRTDHSAPKHDSLTAFIVDMRAPGVEARPLRQMTGGCSFNEVFFTDVRVPDASRLGSIGDGWRVARTTLGFERAGASGMSAPTAARLLATARHLGRADDPVVRQLLARAVTHQKLLRLNKERVLARQRAGEAPGPEGSIGKLFWTEGLQLLNQVASEILGPRLLADTGEWGTYAWVEHVLGTPGCRVAAGTDEVQRNILSERVLGLPREARAQNAEREV